MCSVIQRQIHEYVSDISNSPLGVQLSENLLELSQRVSHVASKVWQYVDIARQHIDDGVVWLRGGISWFIKSSLSSLTARFVLYSLNELTGEEYQEAANQELAALEKEGSTAEQIHFPTTQNATLSVATILHPEAKNPQKKTIVYFPTNFELWQMPYTRGYLKALHTDAAVNIHAINYPGTGGSTGFPEVEETLINDGLNYVQHLIKDGVHPSNIALVGGDIGGALATIIASKLAAENHTVHVVSIRSFRSLTSMIETIFPLASHKVAQFAAAMNWKLDVETVLPTLKGRFICMYNEHDPMIPVAVSIKTALENAPAGSLQFASIEYLKMDDDAFALENKTMAEDPDCTPHVRPLAKTEVAQIAASIKRIWDVNLV